MESTVLSPVTEVTSFRGLQVTGITIDCEGRMFVNFPRWRDDIPFSVAEICPNGHRKPYPDLAMNTWEEGDATTSGNFICVQSVLARADKLYVLDTKNPGMKQVIGIPTIYVFDLKTDQLVRTYPLTESVNSFSYINDLRIDEKNGKIYLTDSGTPGLIVVDRETGENYRMLDGHPFTTAEVNHIRAGGKEYLATVHADGIALDEKSDILYFHALTGYTLYGIPTRQLIRRQVEEDKIFRMHTPAPDGMLLDDQGNLYMGDLEKNAIVYLTPDKKEIRTLAEGGSISWPDTFALWNGELYFTNSRVQDVTGDISELVFPIDKIKLPV